MRRYAIVLAILALAFLGRVLGQLAVLLFRPGILPPMEEWYSGVLPYPVLLSTQVAILVFQFEVSRQLWTGTGALTVARTRIGAGLKWFSLVYFLTMVVRYVVTMTIWPERRWLGGTIPIFFHWVLAAYVYVLSRHHRNLSLGAQPAHGADHGEDSLLRRGQSRPVRRHRRCRVIAPYRIRKASASDVPLLPDVERSAASLFEEHQERLGLGSLGRVNSIDTFRRAQESELLWVVTDESDRPVGFALVLEIDGLAHLDELDVLPEHGRRGLGAALLRQVCTWADENGYEAVTLSTFRDVAWNAPFYARHGFRILEPEEMSPGLVELVEEERARGLRTELRAIMRKESGG